MIRITIEADDIVYCYVRLEDGSGQWGWRNRHTKGWGPVITLMGGSDVLWDVAGLCNPPFVQPSEPVPDTPVSVNDDSES